MFDAYMNTMTDGNDGVKELLMEFIGVCISNVKGWRMKKGIISCRTGRHGEIAT